MSTALITDPVRVGWSDFLAREHWDCFGTLSYRPRKDEFGRIVFDGCGPVGFLRHFYKWLDQWCYSTAERLGKAYRDNRGRWCGWYANRRKKGKSRPVWVFGLEPHQSGKLHAHTLIRHSDDLPGLRWTDGWSLWFKAHGRNRIEPPVRQGDTCTYITKYVTKPGSQLYLSESFDAASLVTDYS